MVLAPDGRWAGSLTEPRLWRAAAVFVLGARRVNLLVSPATAVALVAVLRAWT
jgi:hypothetical protein